MGLHGILAGRGLVAKGKPSMVFCIVISRTDNFQQGQELCQREPYFYPQDRSQYQIY